MKLTFAPLVATMTLHLTLSAPAQEKEIIGYFPSWKWRPQKSLLTPEKIPYSKLTTITYAFFYPLPDGDVVGRDSLGDAKFLRAAPGTRLTDIAHANGVKVLLSIGGWEDSRNFPQVAADPIKRTRFAHSCMDCIRTYGFDGIDIDWEFPGYADHNGTITDKDNFTLLLRILRDSLSTRRGTNGGPQQGKPLLLTAALPAGPSHASNIDVPGVANILDYLNIMTYDFYGPWDSLVNHNCPLYPRPGSDSALCVDGAFKLYHLTYGVPSSKITLGVPFYGQTYSRCSALNAPHSGPDTVHFPPSGAGYSDIAEQLQHFTRVWDAYAKVPYLISREWNSLVSYDDPVSIRYKAQYALDKDVRGLIIWEITADYMPDGTTPLLDAVASTLHPSPSGH